MTRIRKAWQIEHEDYDGAWIVHAPTRSKAKIKSFLDADGRFNEVFGITCCRRSPANDVHFPEPHRLLADLTEKERDIVLHAFGVRGEKFGFRDHFCTAAGDRRLLRLSWEFGLFTGPHGKDPYAGDGPWVGNFFYLTDLGRAVALSMVPTYGGWL